MFESFSGDNNNRRGHQPLCVCLSCGNDRVQPIDWTEVGANHWHLTMRCPDCEDRREAIFDQDTMDEFDVARRHFRDDTHMSDALAFGAVAFKEDKVAGLGIVEFYDFTVLGLRCAGMRERNIPLVETIADKAGTVETSFGGTTRTVGDM